jgi:RHS repeat-associated protein
MGIDEPLVMHRASTDSFYHVDALGSVVGMSDDYGNPAQSYMYSSFGKEAKETGAVPSPYRYTSRESDFESGCYFYRARYYAPSSGRFLSEDPFRGSEWWPQSQNQYLYVANCPSNFRDPSGRWLEILVVAAVATVIIFVVLVAVTKKPMDRAEEIRFWQQCLRIRHEKGLIPDDVHAKAQIALLYEHQKVVQDLVGDMQVLIPALELLTLPASSKGGLSVYPAQQAGEMLGEYLAEQERRGVPRPPDTGGR